jgi:hypothetical protein
MREDRAGDEAGHFAGIVPASQPASQPALRRQELLRTTKKPRQGQRLRQAGMIAEAVTRERDDSTNRGELENGELHNSCSDDGYIPTCALTQAQSAALSSSHLSVSAPPPNLLSTPLHGRPVPHFDASTAQHKHSAAWQTPAPHLLSRVTHRYSRFGRFRCPRLTLWH